MKLNPLVYIVVAVILLIGLFLIFKPKTTSDTSNLDNSNNLNQATNTSGTIPTGVVSNAKVFEITIQGKRITSGPQTLSVSQGEEVVIKITSDEAEEFHVHAYDNSVELEAGKVVELIFVADKSGRFPFELERSKTEIGALEVQPK